jgi:hypothetical protein
MGMALRLESWLENVWIYCLNYVSRSTATDRQCMGTIYYEPLNGEMFTREKTFGFLLWNMHQARITTRV